MATELLQPGVSVIQEFRSVSPTIVTPTLVPCAVGPAFQVLEALEQDATGNNVLNTDALASVPAILSAANPGDYAGLDGLTLKLSVNNGAVQEFTFADPTALNLSAAQVKDQIAASSPAPVGFGAYVVTVGASTYLQLRSTGKGDGQLLKVLDGTGNSIFDFADNYEVEGVSSYSQDKVLVEQANFPDPRGIIDELDVDESSIRCFLSSSGANLKEFLQDSTFLRKYKGCTYTGTAPTYGSFSATKFAFKYKKGGATNEFTFATEPGDIATLVSDMNTLIAALTGLTFVVNGTVIDAKSTFGYFEVVTPSSVSAHANMGWANADKAYTMEPVDDNDGDTRTPFVVVDQDNFNAPADEALLSAANALVGEQQVHNLTFEAAIDGEHMQEITFDGGPILGTGYDGLALNGTILNFTVNGVAKQVTFATANTVPVADAIAEINAAAGTTVCYEVTGEIAFQLGGATAIAGGEIVLINTGSTGITNLGFTAADHYQTLTIAEIVVQINATLGTGVADDTTVATKLTLNSSTKGAESKVAIGKGTANTLIGYTDDAFATGTPFAPAVGDGVYGDGALIGYVALVMPGGYNNRLKLDREILITAGYTSMYIQALGIPSSLPATRPTPDLVVDSGGAVNLKHDFLRDTEGTPITASASLIIMYSALRLDVTPAAANPGLLNLDDTDDLEDALSPINTDNPLALMLYFMLINAPGVVVTGIGVDAVSSLNPDGTALAYSKALSFLESEEVYALAPASQDPIIHQLFMTHVDDQSDPDAKGERIVFINPEMPGEAVPDLATSGTDGDSTAVSNEFDTKLATLAADLLAQGVDPTGTIPVEDGVYLDIASDALRYNVASVTGTKISIRVAFAPGENDDDFYAEANLPTNLISEAFTIYVRGEGLLDSNGDPDRTKIAQAYQDLGALYANRRVMMVAPELVGATIESTEQRIAGYYLCAAIAGMVGQLPPQQGFTNYPITGFTRVLGSNDVFNQTQMNVGAAGGTYWVIQEVAGGPLTCRHQLTTDLTSIETRELSITKVVDFTAKFMRAGLRNFIGKFNITQPFLDTLSTVVQGQLSFLTESGVIIGGDLNNIVQDTSAPDTVLIDVTLDVPYPCNYIRLTLVI